MAVVPAQGLITELLLLMFVRCGTQRDGKEFVYREIGCGQGGRCFIMLVTYVAKKGSDGAAAAN